MVTFTAMYAQVQGLADAQHPCAVYQCGLEATELCLLDNQPGQAFPRLVIGLCPRHANQALAGGWAGAWFTPRSATDDPVLRAVLGRLRERMG
jgi:hypothetical protein